MTRIRSIVRALGMLSLLAFSACTGPGIDAGGESQGSNGGVAFMVMAVMLVLIGVILWFILGRED